MNFNENSFLFSKKENKEDIKKFEIKNNQINPISQFTKINNLVYQHEEKEIEDIDDTDNLRYKDNFENNLNAVIVQRLDSCESSSNFKYSIDIPNISRNRLHQYLNEDLINALDTVPNIPNIHNSNNSISNDLKTSKSNKNNESNNIINNLDNYIIKNQNEINNGIYNYINKAPIYIPMKYRNKDINIENYQENNNEENNHIKNKEVKKTFKKSRNKFSNMNKKIKNKKQLNFREGDWICNSCGNLNFSFRIKCNICKLYKEFNKNIGAINKEIFQLNTNSQLMDSININYNFMNNMHMNVNNINNFNDVENKK